MALGLDRHEVGQPLVVHVVADAEVLEVVPGLGAQERALRLEGDGLAVLAAMEDDLAGDAVSVEVTQAGVDVVVALGAGVSGQGRIAVGQLAEHRPHGGRLLGEGVEVVEVGRRAVGAQLLHQLRPDVGVG